VLSSTCSFFCGDTKQFVEWSCRYEDKEVQKDIKLFPYKIINKDGKPNIQVKIKDGETKVFSPEEISAMVLMKMKETAEAFLGKKIKDAVVTVPGEQTPW
jgi:heat shock protein 5